MSSQLFLFHYSVILWPSIVSFQSLIPYLQVTLLKLILADLHLSQGTWTSFTKAARRSGLPTWLEQALQSVSQLGLLRAQHPILFLLTWMFLLRHLIWSGVPYSALIIIHVSKFASLLSRLLIMECISNELLQPRKHPFWMLAYLNAGKK